MEPLLVLGIMDSHTSSAALLRDGRVLAAVREEVLRRDKGFARFPSLAVRRVLRDVGADGREVDRVAFGITADLFDTPRFQEREQGFKRDAVSLATRCIPRSWARSASLREGWVAAVGRARRHRTLREQARLFEELGLRPERARFLRHHRCHAATALLLSPFREDVLVFVSDGYGDGEAGGVWALRDGRWEQREHLSYADSLGGVYCRMTRVLGMKPWEHEHKVMGLAPYGESPRARALLGELRSLFRVERGRLENATRLTGSLLEAHLARLAQGYRFDQVAWALQRFTEELLCAWVQHHIRATGIRSVALAGGVFLNVKANMAIGALGGLERLFVMPAAGDDSASIGAALACWADELGWVEAHRRAQALEGLYLGPELDPDEVDRVAREAAAEGCLVRRPVDLAAAVAGLLVEGAVVARCAGRAEFGPRALGNRSILCRADHLQVPRDINRMIKKRDFWMPFAPTVLDRGAPELLDNPKAHPAPWMVLATGTTARGRGALAAALHPHDHSARPQVLRREDNPEYYELIEAYARLSGTPALLNTSFNLHGEPIVCSATDASRTFRGSGLRHLALGPWLISKPG